MAGLLALALPVAARAAEAPLQVGIWVTGDRERMVEALTPADLEAEVAGQLRPVAAVTPRIELESPPVTQLLFDFSLSRPAGVRGVAAALAERVEALVALGPVEVAVVDPEIRVLLPPTTDPERLRQSLDRVVVADVEGDALETRRQQLEIAARAQPARFEELAAEAAREELLMLRRQHDQLIRWLAAHGDRAAGPRILFLFSEGLLVDPLLGYGARGLSGQASARLAPLLPSAAELAEVAAAHGWSLHPILTSRDDAGPRLDYRPDEQTPVGFRVRFGGRDRDDEEGAAAPTRLIETDAAAWRSLAHATGGAAIQRLAGLDAALAAAAGQWSVELAAAPGGAPSGEGVELTLRAVAGNRRVRAPARLPGGHPVAVSAATARLALADELGEPTLAVAARLDLGAPVAGQSSATLETRIELAAAGEIGPRWRVTHAFETLAGDTVVRSAELDPATTERTGTAVRRVDEVLLPAGAARSLVLVEDLERGLWGVARPEIAAAEPVPVSDAVARAIAREESFRLLSPETPRDPKTLRGRVTFRTEAEPVVARVHFLLNGKRVARRNRRPFEARIDLGDSGRTQQLVAVAFDAAGNEIDRDRLVLNEPATSFWVRVIEPRPGARPAGPTAVEAELKLPAGSRLRGLTFYWKDTPLETLTAPPWRRELTLPIGDPEGYLRAEAQLDDGRIAEDVVVMTQKGFGEQIEVDLVDLFVVAVDRNGKPVLGLGRDDFEVFEDGSPQTIESFEVAGDLPITVGLAIDSSSSLFVQMPAVKAAAERFTDSLVRERDRAFLIGFGSRPRLIAPPTGNLQRVRDGIRSLQPYGSTAVWDALEMALEQIESTAGRRALVVFYDGDDEDERRSFERSLELARRARVPVYLILMNNEAARTEGRSLQSRAFVSKLERLARAGGGRVYYVPTDQTRDAERRLDTIFDSIAEELRSHYLITYYPELEPGGPLWRPVEVRIAQRGLTARTIEGRETDLP
ncbi:MAG TPA: VWA domain-containing protein [Thermoanaerobaculia bacterium]|nr:VWA domain-containing protein [Thermoanaerobaculia bacterium]